MNENVIKSSIDNINNFVVELLLALGSLRKSTQSWGTYLFKADYLLDEEREITYSRYSILCEELYSIYSKLDKLKKDLKSVDLTSFRTEELDQFIQTKKIIFNSLRICYSQFAALVTCLNWQSPSIKSSKSSRVGIERSRVKADWNDYKRDRSEDTFYCEELLKKNVIITKNTGTKSVLNVCNSGMAAFTTIIYFLIGEGITKNKILASSQIYVESRMLLKRFFKDKFETFSYNDTYLIVKNILSVKPDAIFIEPLTNTNNLRLFDVVEIVKEVSKVYKREIYFLFDVTCIIGFENFFDNFKIPRNIKIILYGSILKSPQIGLERANAGFVQAFGLGKLSEKILDYRTLSGTTIQDVASNSFPFTTKELLQKRMKIIEANAVNLASSLLNIDPEHKIISEVVYPGIPLHKDYLIAKKLGFAGTFFNIKFISKYSNDKYFELFTREVINFAKRYDSDIVHGASFGFNETSIYYSVGWDEPEDHYIRVSAGTETIYEVEKIKNVFKEAFFCFKKKLSHSSKKE